MFPDDKRSHEILRVLLPVFSAFKMSTNYGFEGWMGLDPDSAKGNMKWQGYEPKKFEDADVDIKITHCGICGYVLYLLRDESMTLMRLTRRSSDLHTLRAGWNPNTDFPVLVGHEIVGTAVRVGPKAEGGIKVGDRVGVGPQAASCLRLDCDECSNNLEEYCPNQCTHTHGDKYPDGTKSYGGFADYWRGHSHFAIKIPDTIAPEAAAPMLCGGITMYMPLVRNKVGPNKVSSQPLDHNISLTKYRGLVLLVSAAWVILGSFGLEQWDVLRSSLSPALLSRKPML